MYGISGKSVSEFVSVRLKVISYSGVWLFILPSVPHNFAVKPFDFIFKSFISILFFVRVKRPFISVLFFM